MKRLTRPRRSLWLVLGLVIGVLATAATMAAAGLQPADLNFTPQHGGADDERRRRSGVDQELLRSPLGRHRARRTGRGTRR